MENDTFLSSVDANKVEALISETDTNVDYFVRITDNVVNSYTKDLDSLLMRLKEDLQMQNEIPAADLECYCLTLTNMLYFMGEQSEKLGIHDDMSLSAQKEVYNRAYLGNQVKAADKTNKTTVSENQAVAEEASKYEKVVNNIYARAYKIIKYKIDAGYRMVDVLRKIITKRMQDEQLSAYQSRGSYGVSAE